MGNRCTITRPQKDVDIYLHWNGGRDSVEAFLEYCRLRNFRSPESDSYGLARLTQVVANFFGGGLSIGIGAVGENIKSINPGDNGCYVVGEDWKIVERLFFNDAEQNTYDRAEILAAIDEAQPYKEQLGKEFLSSEEVPTNELKVGDVVSIPDWEGVYSRVSVAGIGEDRLVNGRNVAGIPYTDRYLPNNINSYILTPTVRRAVSASAVSTSDEDLRDMLSPLL